MDLKLATTVEIVEELVVRDLHFVFVGLSPRNRGRSDVYYACHGDSPREVMNLLDLLRRRIRRH